MPSTALTVRVTRLRLALVFGLILGAVAAALAHTAVPQDPAYHAFADARARFGIPNFWNVASNLAFLPVGLWGLRSLRRARFHEPVEARAWAVFFLGLGLVCFGSGWYHLHPDNGSLFWDRLPMTVAFMSLLSAMVSERISVKAGAALLLPLLLLGAASVLLWRRSELSGHGDLRLYFLVQFLPMVLIPLLMALFPRCYDRTGAFDWMVLWYVAAKLLEHWDAAVFRATGGIAGGHALKHLAAALAVAGMVPMLLKRKPLGPAPGAAA
ncbi:MAG TPA: hypothetical protein VJ483_09720 [Holophagaceae bacterium]|nr:hypothetical protein [Holophagaceae bacterium]